MANWEEIQGLERELIRDKKLKEKEIDSVKVLEYDNRIVLRLGRRGFTSTRDIVIERHNAVRWPGNLFSYAKSLLDILLISWKAENNPSQREQEVGDEEE